MSDKERIEELEKRVRDLEARPYWPPTIIIQPAPPQPTYPVWPAHPWSPLQPRFGEPWIVYGDGHSITVTS